MIVNPTQSASGSGRADYTAFRVVDVPEVRNNSTVTINIYYQDQDEIWVYTSFPLWVVHSEENIPCKKNSVTIYELKQAGNPKEGRVVVQTTIEDGVLTFTPAIIPV